MADTKSFFTVALLRNTSPACQKAKRASLFCRATGGSITLANGNMCYALQMTTIPPLLIRLSLIAGLFFAGSSLYPLHAYANKTIVLDTAAQATHALVQQIGEQRFTAPDFRPGTVQHMVMFQFRPSATVAERQEVTRRFLELATHSRRPNGAPVIANLEAGPQNSGENADLGLDYGYLVTFRSEGDRNYYIGRPIVHTSGYFDPTHDAFKKFAAPFLANVVVFDFTAQ